MRADAINYLVLIDVVQALVPLHGRVMFDQEVGQLMRGYLTTEEMRAAIAPVCRLLP